MHTQTCKRRWLWADRRRNVLFSFLAWTVKFLTEDLGDQMDNYLIIFNLNRSMC